MLSVSAKDLKETYTLVRRGPVPLARYLNSLGITTATPVSSLDPINTEMNRLRVHVKGATEMGPGGEKKTQYLQEVKFANYRVKHCFVNGIPLETYTQLRHGTKTNPEGFVITSRGNCVHAVESLNIG